MVPFGLVTTTAKIGENSHSVLQIIIPESICASNFHAGRVYLAMTGLDYDDFGPFIYVSENHGKDWKFISNDLPEQPVNVIMEDSRFPEILFVGTHRGVFISVDRGGHLATLRQRIPIGPCR